MYPNIGDKIHYNQTHKWTKESYPVIGIEAWFEDNWEALTKPYDISAYFTETNPDPQHILWSKTRRHRAIIDGPDGRNLHIFPSAYQICSDVCNICKPKEN